MHITIRSTVTPWVSKQLPGSVQILVTVIALPFMALDPLVCRAASPTTLCRDSFAHPGSINKTSCDAIF